MLTRPLCKENIKRFVVFYAVAEDMLAGDIFADIHRHFHCRNGFATVIFDIAALTLGDFYYRPRLPLIVMPSPSKSTETVLLSVMLRSIIPSAMLSSSFCSITLLKGRAPYSMS